MLTKTHFAFIERKGGSPDVKLWVVEDDGKNPVARTGFEIGSEYSWSPDGKWIAVAHTKDGNYEIYKLRVDGSQLVRLTKNQFTDRYPRWSPKGDKIAFVSRRYGDEDIYVIDADGTGEKNLMPGDGSENWNRQPSWSWDGKKIAFVASRYPATGGALSKPFARWMWLLCKLPKLRISHTSEQDLYGTTTSYFIMTDILLSDTTLLQAGPRIWAFIRVRCPLLLH